MNIDNLTDEQKRVKIAEACGFTQNEKGFWFEPGKAHDWRVSLIDDIVPDYLNDLNAMHEAEEVMNPFAIDDYIEQLGRITREEWGAKGKRIEKFSAKSVIYAHAHATARQRVDAFLLAL